MLQVEVGKGKPYIQRGDGNIRPTLWTRWFCISVRSVYEPPKYMLNFGYPGTCGYASAYLKSMAPDRETDTGLCTRGPAVSGRRPPRRRNLHRNHPDPHRLVLQGSSSPTQVGSHHCAAFCPLRTGTDNFYMAFWRRTYVKLIGTTCSCCRHRIKSDILPYNFTRIVLFRMPFVEADLWWNLGMGWFQS